MNSNYLDLIKLTCRWQGVNNRWKSMIGKSIDQSITIDYLLLIGIDWHRSIDGQSIITQKLSRTSFAIDWRSKQIPVSCILFQRGRATHKNVLNKQTRKKETNLS